MEKMDRDTLFERVVNAAEAAFSYHTGATKKLESDYSLVDILLECMRMKESILFSTKQLDEFERLALRSLNGGIAPLALPALMAFGGASDFKYSLESSFIIPPIFQCEPVVHPNNILISLLDKAGVFENGEYPIYRDWGSLSLIKRKQGIRSGVIVVTNTRILIVGSSLYKSKKYRLFYNNWKDMPYLDALDFIYYEDFEDASIQADFIPIRWAGRYFEVKKREFYGPYYLRYGMPDSVKVKEGIIDIFISPHDFGNNDVSKRTYELGEQALLMRNALIS